MRSKRRDKYIAFGARSSTFFDAYATATERQSLMLLPIQSFNRKCFCKLEPLLRLPAPTVNMMSIALTTHDDIDTAHLIRSHRCRQSTAIMAGAENARGWWQILLIRIVEIDTIGCSENCCRYKPPRHLCVSVEFDMQLLRRRTIIIARMQIPLRENISLNGVWINVNYE